jgi:hypothetical protein
VLAGYGLVWGVMPALARPLGWVARHLHYNPRRLRWLVQGLILALAALSNIYLVASYTLGAATYHPLFFHTTDRVAAVEWLGTHSQWDETVLASEKTGSWIVGAIGHRVVLGHWAETVDYQGKQAAVALFYAAETSDGERRALAEVWGVDYVFHGVDEHALGDYDPATTSWLELVFQSGAVAIYRVTLRGE